MNPCANNLLKKNIDDEILARQTDPDDLVFNYLKIIKRVFIYVLMFQNLQGDLPEMYIRLY